MHLQAAHKRKRPPNPDKLHAYRLIQLGQWMWRGALDEVGEPRELAKHYHQLAGRCYRLAAIAAEPAVSDGFRRIGDDLAAKADYLEANGGQGDQAGAG